MKNINVLSKIVSMILICCGAISYVHAEDRGNGFHNPHFSPDGKLLAFDLCRNKNCDSVTYDIEASTFTKLVDRKGKKIANLSFSPDGNSVLFVAITEARWPLKKSSQQLAMGPLTSAKFNLITTGDGMKMYPTFSEENAVLYWAIKEIQSKKSGKTYKETQLVELDINSRKSRNVMPKKFNFYRPSPPYSLGDGERVITSMFGFRQPGPLGDDWLKAENLDEVLVMSESKETVTSLDTGVKDSSNPRIIRQTGQIVFMGRIQQKKGQRGFAYEVYLYDPKGSTQLTTFQTYMRGMDVSVDGKTLALVLATPDRKNLSGRLVLFDVKTKQHREIDPKDIVDIFVDIEN